MDPLGLTCTYCNMPRHTRRGSSALTFSGNRSFRCWQPSTLVATEDMPLEILKKRASKALTSYLCHIVVTVTGRPAPNLFTSAPDDRRRPGRLWRPPSPRLSGPLRAQSREAGRRDDGRVEWMRGEMNMFLVAYSQLFVNCSHLFRTV